MNRVRLHSELIRDEANRLKPYRDSVGKLTIGIGRNLDDRGISKEESFFLFKNDLNRVEAEALSVFPQFPNFSNSRQRALINMLFNLGLSRFLGFKRMIAAIHNNDWGKAADEALDSRAARQTGERYSRIAKLLREG